MFCFCFLSKIGLEPIWEEKDPGRKKSGGSREELKEKKDI